MQRKLTQGSMEASVSRSQVLGSGSQALVVGMG